MTAERRTDSGQWVAVTHVDLPPLNTVVEIDMGREDRGVFRLATLVQRSHGFWWVTCDEHPERQFEEPRAINRLAPGQVWRWRYID